MITKEYYKVVLEKDGVLYPPNIIHSKDRSSYVEGEWYEIEDPNPSLKGYRSPGWFYSFVRKEDAERYCEKIRKKHSPKNRDMNVVIRKVSLGGSIRFLDIHGEPYVASTKMMFIPPRVYRVKRFAVTSTTVTLYHNAETKYADRILREGLIPQVGILTSGEVSGRTGSKIPGIVYLGSKLMAGGTGYYRKKYGYSQDEGVMFKIEMPRREFDRLRLVDNPERLGARNLEEYIRIRSSQDSVPRPAEYRQRWKVINPPYTYCVADRIDPRWITKL